ncbi:MAG: hypothetical protein HYY61_03010 [Deltaproteobacteria bacterium]|nr:hypothetical protein [Deltaproteobacteria bacterium]
MKKLFKTLGVLMGLLAWFSIILGCATLSKERVVALVGDDAILEEEVNQKIPRGVFEDKKMLAQMQKKELMTLVVENLLKKEAEKHKKTTSELLVKNVYRKIKPIQKKDIQTYFNKNKDRFKKMVFEDAQMLIKESIYRERKRDALSAYFNILIKNGNVRLFLSDS